MLHAEFVNKAIELAITEADNGLFYLEPDFGMILRDHQMFSSDISDYPIQWDELTEILEREVTRRNTINSKKPVVINWLYDLITTQVEPAMLAEEADYIKQVTEFMKANHEAQRIAEQEEWDNFKKS